MSILPPRTPLPDTPFRRRHTPGTASGRRGYERYRHCLRWEFGFTCAFCLLHESDLAVGVGDGLPAAGSGQFTIEHLQPQATVPSRRNDYSNCYYACRRCNLARTLKYQLVSRDGAQLLDPCRVAWANHFSAGGDEYRPNENDLHAD